jgi:hypothetical protein
MNTPSDSRGTPLISNPLIPIALIIVALSLVPILLYVVAPEGPMKEGDVVYAGGRYRVDLMSAGLYRQAGYDRSCVLEPRDRLIVVQAANARRDGAMIAKLHGKTAAEAPFCPPDADVRVHPHQVFQKTGLPDELKARLLNIFRS